MLPANFVGIVLALLSSATWGGGDFLGGFSTRKHPPYVVLSLSGLAGVLVLIVCHLIWPEPFPAWSLTIWAMLAGLCGVFGLASLYRALSMGHSATVAPTAAVIGAVIPVLYGISRDGLPGPIRIAGFILALIGIWLVSYVPGSDQKTTSSSLLLAVLAGISFGGFFIFISLAGPKSTFTPLIISRSTFFIITSIILLFQREKITGAIDSPTVWLTGVFDAGGNALYMLAKQFTRLDTAVILSSLYPAVTVLLSRIILKERISRLQWVGVGLCFCAVVLISI
jgi:drug/metabolite transporter (DMT)-like permease